MSVEAKSPSTLELQREAPMEVLLRDSCERGEKKKLERRECEPKNAERFSLLLVEKCGILPLDNTVRLL